MPSQTFRFKPRYRGLALGTIGIGGTLGVLSGALGFLALPLVTGAIGVALGGGYLLSPAWKLAVTVDDAGLRVGTVRPNGKERFALAWADIAAVISSASTKTCYVDGGAPGNSLLVPGDGAPAPYDIVGRAALYDAILAHVAADKVTAVDTLEAYKRTEIEKAAADEKAAKIAAKSKDGAKA